MVGWAGKAEETELADLHARVKLDRHGRRVREFQGDVAGEARVNETRGGVSEQAEAAEAGLTFKTSGDVVTQRHNLIRGPENKLARMKDELAVSIDVHEAREIRLLSGRIDDRILVVVKETEEAV